MPEHYYLLKTSPEYTRAGVYEKYMQNQIIFSRLKP